MYRKEKKMDNSKRHFYLYAKHWYQVTNHIEDLKIIVASYAGLEPDLVSIEDIISILSGILDDHKGVHGTMPSQLIDRILEHARREPAISLHQNIISAMLSVIAFIPSGLIKAHKRSTNASVRSRLSILSHDL